MQNIVIRDESLEQETIPFAAGFSYLKIDFFLSLKKLRDVQPRWLAAMLFRKSTVSRSNIGRKI
jgi:hypothetical protein